MYYLLITIASLLFSIQFLFNRNYQLKRGNSPRAAVLYLIPAYAAGGLILWAINHFHFEITPFTLLMAFINATNLVLFSLFSIKALGKVNLSMYSVFSMIGGMLVPYIAAVIFFDEKVSVKNLICLFLIIIALVITVSGKDKKSGIGYCFGVFIFNGLAGVIAKVFSWASYDKTSSAGFSVISAMCVLLISLILLVFIREPKLEKSASADMFAAGYGVVNCVANLMVLVSLSKLPAAVQYPFTTGGVMIFSTIISFFTKDKPSKREIASVAIAFVAMMLLI